MTTTAPDVKDPKFLAAIDLLKRAGIREFRIAYSDEDDGEPVVWYAAGTWLLDPTTHRPVPTGGRPAHEAAAAMNPLDAVLRLCREILAGGACAHCQRATIFDPTMQAATAGDATSCVYAWDPELNTFRRGCEGDNP